MNFQTRTRCPSCLHAGYVAVHSEPMDGAALSGYFKDHYAGRARLDAVQGASYELVRCQGCALAYQRTVPDEALLSEVYDEWIPSSERQRLRERSDLDSYRYLSEQIDYLIQVSNLPPWRLDLLDFGLGWSEWARMAAAYGCNVFGTELSVRRRAYAEEIGISILEFERLGENRFDYINTEQVFEHLIEPRAILFALVTALKPNGVLKISVPNSKSAIRAIERTSSFAAVSNEDIKTISPLEHVNCFENKTLVRLGAQAGLVPMRPHFGALYNASAGWFDLRRTARLLARSIYRHGYPGSTFLYFRKPGP